jgi:phage shock protein PspC (stress-responsive transcriptional regulator)
MNKVITINLGGTAYQLEEVGFDALREYLDDAADRLRGNPDRDEIVADIELAIGEKFRSRLSNYKNVVTAPEVEAVLAEMGPVQGDSDFAAGEGPDSASHASAHSGAATDTATSTGTRTTPKRLYCIRDGAMLCGVCNGIAAYFNIDPTVVRLAFALLTLFWGTGVVVYLILAVVVPDASTAEEKAAAHGAPFTAQEFIRRAKAGYYDAMKSFPDRKARREWKRKFKQDMREWRMNFHRETGAMPRWRYRWCRGNASAGLHPGLGVALPLFSTLQAAIIVLWISALISLLATGGVFGVMLPASVPVWAGVLIVLFAYGFFVWPLKMMRRACYYDLGGPRWAWPALFFLDAAVWLAAAVALLVLSKHYLPQVHAAVHNLPPAVHQAVTDIRDWWHQR